VKELLHAPGEIALGAADEALAPEAVEGLVRDLGRAANGLELIVVLDHAERLDDSVRRDRLDTAGIQPRVPFVRDGGRLEADLAAELVGEALEQVALRLDDLDPVELVGALQIAEVGEQANAVGLDEERGVRAGETGQVADVDGIGDEERALERLAQPGDPVAHRLFTRNSSASRYPSGPLPMITFAATSAVTELRRHSSRS
jgi:hypothetical protein